MRLVPPYIESLRPYEPGRSPDEIRRLYSLERVIKLASNENPLGVSPRAVEAMRGALAGCALYPNGGLDLRRVLAEMFALKVENVIAGSGSEGIMANIIRTFLCDDDEVLTTEAAFIGFQVLAKSRGVTYRTVPYRDWRYDLTALAHEINEHTKIIYLANPNNPTGTIFTKREFEDFYRHVPERVLIILDEAYFEYAKDNPRYPDSMHYRYDNVITLRTFSGVDPVPTEANFVMVPLESAAEAQRVNEGMLKRGIIIRPLGAFGLPHCIRISTGTDEENEVCVEALRAVLRR